MDMSFVSSLLLAAIIVEALTEAWVASDPLEGLRHWLGSKHELLGVLVQCGKCSSFWIASLAFLPTEMLLVLATPLGAWRLSNLWHDLLSWLAFRKDLAREQLDA